MACIRAFVLIIKRLLSGPKKVPSERIKPSIETVIVEPGCRSSFRCERLYLISPSNCPFSSAVNSRRRANEVVNRSIDCLRSGSNEKKPVACAFNKDVWPIRDGSSGRSPVRIPGELYDCPTMFVLPSGFTIFHCKLHPTTSLSVLFPTKTQNGEAASISELRCSSFPAKNVDSSLLYSRSTGVISTNSSSDTLLIITLGPALGLVRSLFSTKAPHNESRKIKTKRV